MAEPLTTPELTDQWHTTTDLAPERDKLRTIIESLDEGLVVLDERLCVESINAQGAEILQTAADALLGRPIDDVAAEWNLRDRGPFAVSKMRHHLTRGLAYRNDDAFVVTANGDVNHVSLVMTPIERDDRQAGAVICLRDIGELKLAENRLRHSEQRFRRIFQSAPTGMIRISAEGVVDDSNEAAQTILGSNDLTDRALAQLWHPDEAADNAVLLAALLADDGPGLWQGELRFRHPDGHTIWTNTSLALVVPGGDEPPFAIAVIEDVTQRKRLEIELRHAQKLESIGRLSAGIAHEMNSPMQFIGDNLHFLGAAFADLSRFASDPASMDDQHDVGELRFLLDEVPQAIEQTLDGVARVADIVQAMQTFGSASSGVITSVDLNETIRTTVLVAASSLQDVADVECEYGEIPAVPCSLIDLNQVLLNLLVNAADAITELVGDSGLRGRIRLTTRRRGDGVEISIADTGAGIAAEHEGHVFDPFFTTKEVGRGTGQGLSVAHAVIVDRHRGELSFETVPGAGTTFRIWLPVHAPVGP